MTDYYDPLPFSEEQFAAWLDGTMSPDQQQLFMQECASNPDMQLLLDANDNIDDSFEEMVANGYELPEELYADDFQLPEIGDFDDGDDHVFDFDEQMADNDQLADDDQIAHVDDIAGVGHADITDTNDYDQLADDDQMADIDYNADADDLSADDIDSGTDQFFI